MYIMLGFMLLVIGLVLVGHSIADHNWITFAVGTILTISYFVCCEIEERIKVGRIKNRLRDLKNAGDVCRETDKES